MISLVVNGKNVFIVFIDDFISYKIVIFDIVIVSCDCDDIVFYLIFINVGCIWWLRESRCIVVDIL